MTALLLAVAVLAADPTAAEQKLIEKARKELSAARDKAGRPLLAKVEVAKIELAAIEAGEIDPKLRKTFVRKAVDGEPVYVFRHESYREKEREEVAGIAKSKSLINDMNNTPPLNLLNLRRGAVGRLALTVNNQYVSAIKENEPGPDGVNLLIVVGSFDNSFRPVEVRVNIRGTTMVTNDARLSCAVIGMKRVHGKPVFELLAVEQFDNSGNVIGN